MKRALGAALAATSMALAAGCGGEKAVEQPGNVVGFSYVIDGAIVEGQWKSYEDMDHVLGGTVRDVSDSEEFVRCEEVVDDLSFWGSGDDLDCLIHLSWCASEEGTHCEAVYETSYSFERWEQVVVEECRAPIRRREFKPIDPVVDETCPAPGPDQRLRQRARYFIWVSTKNPEYGSENPDEDVFLTDRTEINSSQWSEISRASDLTVRIKEGNITKVVINAAA